MKTIGITSPTEGLEHFFTEEKGWLPVIIKQHSERLPDVDVICFSGGSDVWPVLYGEKTGKRTVCDWKRDVWELTLVEHYYNAPKIGICRGAQFLSVVAGARLVQDIPGHRNCAHKVLDIRSNLYVETRGDHHQCVEYEDVYHLFDPIAESKEDDIPEAWYIDRLNALCVQFHPEYGPYEAEQYFFDLVNEYLYKGESED